MTDVEYALVDNQLTAEDFVRLKVATGFMDRPLEQVDKAIKNSLFHVSAICDGKVVGMGRLVGDGAMYWYLQEIISGISRKRNRQKYCKQTFGVCQRNVCSGYRS